MSVFSRFKRDASGFRALIELWESTPKERREKMIEVGRAEDPHYTEEALKYVMTFPDVLALDDMELADVIAAAQPRLTAFAIRLLKPEIHERFLKNCKGPIASQIRDFLEQEPSLRDVGAAQLHLVTVTRSLERKGILKVKQIPLQQPRSY